MTKRARYSPEVRDRAVRLVFERIGGTENRLYVGDVAEVGAAS
jgi:transposase-like protein